MLRWWCRDILSVEKVSVCGTFWQCRNAVVKLHSRRVANLLEEIFTRVENWRLPVL